jgi:hypothetical protein
MVKRKEIRNSIAEFIIFQIEGKEQIITKYTTNIPEFLYSFEQFNSCGVLLMNFSTKVFQKGVTNETNPMNINNLQQ